MPTSISANLRPLFARAGRRLLEAVLPARCLGCGAMVESTGLLCHDCWTEIDFIGPPFCACCGLPFEYAQPLGEEAAMLCGACIGRPPEYERARAVFRYDERSRRLVLGFKHGDRLNGASAFGRWMARAGSELIADADLIAPVPLHWTRLFRRRYNQAALLAYAIARPTGLPVVPDLLLRRKRTPSQGRLSASDRKRNMQGAFAVKPGHKKRIEGRNVLLVDDVLTTGATVEACARALKRAGAGAVEVLTLARVVRPRH